MVYLYSVLCCLILFPYFGWRGGQALGPRWRRWWWGLLAVVYALYALALVVHRHVVADWMSWVMNASIYLFFSMMYVAGYVMLANGYVHIDRWLGGPYSRAKATTRRALGRWLFATSLLLLVGMMAWGHYNVRYPRVIYSRLDIKRLTPAGAEPQKRLRVLFFSDLHIGEGMTPDYIRRAVDLIQSQRADLILCGGDYIDHRNVYAYDPRVVHQMRRLRAPLGVYFVLGNHEYRDDLEGNIRYVPFVGGTLLQDSIAYPGDSLVALLGRKDKVDEGRKPLDSLVGTLEHSPRPVIMMEHTPASIDSLGQTPIDLMLCGHTHGGQIWPGQLMVIAKYGMASGVRRVGDKELCISEGLGSAGGTYRIGTRSEVRVYDLYW